MKRMIPMGAIFLATLGMAYSHNASCEATVRVKPASKSCHDLNSEVLPLPIPREEIKYITPPYF